MVDLHAHLLPGTLLASLGAEGDGGVGYDTGTRQLRLDGEVSRPVPELLTDLERRSAWNAARGIELQVLSPWLDVAGDALPVEQAVRWTAAMNDATAREIAELPAYAAFATLPVGDGAAAAHELRRAVGELGFVGAAIPTQVGGRNLDDAGLEPLFGAATELGVPLFLHPYRVLGAERLARDFLSNVCGNPFETTVAALSLFFGGVFDRHPGLVVLLAHAGGSLPVLAGRAVHACRAGAATRRPVDDVEEILGCFYYDTVLHDPAALAYAVSRLGPERMVLGTDYPFPMLVDDPAAMVRAAVAGAPAGAFEQITSSGPRRLVGR